MIPTLLGFPLWRGRIKRRVAKKWLRRLKIRWFLGEFAQTNLARLDIGDYVNDCSGRNGKIEDLCAVYRRVGKGRGAVLLNVELQTTNRGCSLCHCGIEPKLSREEVERRLSRHLKGWTLAEGGQTWFGANTSRYQKVVAHAEKVLATINAGEHVLNENADAYLAGFEPPDIWAES